MRYRSDFLVIGSGIAGLAFAAEASKYGRVSIVTKRAAEESATLYAQGGIASVLDSHDTFESHVHDTVAAGRGLCDRDVVEMCVREGPDRIRELQTFGAQFTAHTGHPEELALGREGGHSVRRIVHAADATGQEIMRALMAHVRGLSNVELLEDHLAVDLIVPGRGTSGRRCIGAYVLEKQTGEIHTRLAATTVLATGGAGKVYLYTSNPDVATGDGIAMAYRAGASVANMEFFQFHPTILYHHQAKGSLISEAVRGEGGILRDLDGRAFMADYHPDRELAPRDVVARAIDAEMKRTGDDHVMLDVTHLSSDFLGERFPNISSKCAQYGIDITNEPVPVVPAAHFSCGGVASDLDGATDVPGLFAIGETAWTGFHGANRLASNSLLEGLVFAKQAAVAARARIAAIDDGSVRDWQVGDAVESDESVVVSQDWDEIRRYMWNYVGIVRSDRRLTRARRRHDLMLQEIQEYYWKYHVTADLLELRNIATVAHLIIDSAIARKESRGLHFTSDYPGSDVRYERNTILRRYH